MVDTMNARRGPPRRKCDNTKATSEFFELYDEIQARSINEKHRYYLSEAAKVATSSDMNHKHGAVIVYKKKIISCGSNHKIDYFCHNYSVHAEVAAISNLKGKQKELLSECELYVVRIAPIKFNNVLKYSKPCEKCQAAINKFNIKKIYYSTNYEYDAISCDAMS